MYAVAAIVAPVLAVLTTPTPTVAAQNPCPSGLVALTFDDGPDSALTPRFLDVLRERRAPATFFVVGQRVAAAPHLVRRAAELGFGIGNHTYGHEDLVRLSDDRVASTLRRARRAIRAAGVVPSPLMRPPYGSIDQRVRGVVADLGLVPVLWTADPRDWDGKSAGAIVRSVLGQLEPGSPNVVLLHDGVTNSGETLAALPRLIRGVRERGYCLAGLDRRGRPRPPVPDVRVSDASVREQPGGARLRFTLSLDRATSRPTSVRLRTFAGTATSGKDYVAVDTRVRFPVGVRRAVVAVRVRDDLRDEPPERLRVRLAAPRGLRITDRRGVGTVLDDDPPPRLAVRDVEVVEPTTGTLDVPVRLRLSRPSGKPVAFTVTTVPGTADAGDFEPVTERFSLPPGRVAAVFTVRVLSDELDEPVEFLTVRARAGTNVDLAAATGRLTLLPAPEG